MRDRPTFPPMSMFDLSPPTPNWACVARTFVRQGYGIHETIFNIVVNNAPPPHQFMKKHPHPVHNQCL